MRDGGFSVSLFALLSPLRDLLIYSLYTGGLPLGPIFGDIYICIYIDEYETHITLSPFLHTY